MTFPRKLATLCRRARAVVLRRREELDIAEEVQGHLNMLAERYRSQGLSDADARNAALRDFGGEVQVREHCRDWRGLPAIESIAQDLRIASRSLAKTPAFSVAVVLTLAIAIGANSAVFSLISAGLLRTLPIEHADRMICISSVERGREQHQRWVAPADYRVWQSSTSHIFEALAAIDAPGFTIRTGDRTLRSFGARVNGPVFEMLNARASIGRLLTAADQRSGAPPVVVLSHGLWQALFAGDPAIVGKSLLINGRNHEVAGVLSETFRFPLRFDLWIPLAASDPLWEQTDLGSLFVIGTLRSGVSPERADLEMASLAARQSDDQPRSHRGRAATVDLLEKHTTAGMRQPLIIFQLAVALLAIVAGANVANLFLVRSLARGRELAVRVALGGGRGRLVQHVLAETLLLTGMGLVAGLAVASWASGWLAAAIPIGVAVDDWRLEASDVGLDSATIVFAAGVSVVIAAFVAFMPALQTWSTEAASAMRAASRSIVGRGRVQRTLVTVQTALAVLLVGAALLLLQSVWRLQRISPGFDTAQLAKARISLEGSRISTPEQRQRFVARVLEEATALPNVSSVAMANWLPVSGMATRAQVMAGSDVPVAVDLRVVTPSFMQTLGLPVRRGRGVLDSDSERTERVVVLSESLARLIFRDADPVGSHIDLVWQGKHTRAAIVGIAADVRSRGIAEAAPATVYVPHLQSPWNTVELREIALRLKPGADLVARDLSRVLQKLDANIPVYQVSLMQRSVDSGVERPLFSLQLLGGFGGAALLLAALGLYGAISFQVVCSMREIGVRLALGAIPGDVLRGILAMSLRMWAAGAAVGCAALYFLSRALVSAIPGILPLNATVLTGSAAVLLIVTILAAWPAAARGSRVDPAVALRND